MAPFLPDDVLREILRHLQPSCLIRASLVCKHWRSVVTDPCFLRRVRAPVIGVFLNNPFFRANFIPAAAASAPTGVPGSLLHPPAVPWFVHDCRRGLVLLCNKARILVWDPASDDRVAVPQPPVCDRFFSGFSTALLRGPNDEDGARSSRFCVAMAFIEDGVATGAVFSSDTGAWASHVTALAPNYYVLWKEMPGAVVGDAAHWLLNGCRVLKLHAGGQQRQAAMAVLEPRDVPAVNADNVQLMRTHDGELGLAAVTGLALRLWTLTRTGDHAVPSWTPCRTIRFDESLLGPRRGRRYPGRFRDEKLSLASVLALLDCPESDSWARIAGVDEAGGVVFLKRLDGLFMLRLEPTPRITKLYEGCFVMRQRFGIVFPYSSFFHGGNIIR